MRQQIYDFLVPIDSEFDSESIGTSFGSFGLLERKTIFFTALQRREKNYFENASADFRFFWYQSTQNSIPSRLVPISGLLDF